jgi:hypothetical protein
MKLRSRLEHEKERRQWEHAAGRDWDRNRSREWHRSKDHRREEERRSVGGPSRDQEQVKQRKVGVRKYSAKSRASTMATITPMPTPSPPLNQEKVGDTGVLGMPVGTSRVAEPMGVTTPPPPLAPTTTPSPTLPKQGLHKLYQKKLMKKQGSKSSVGSSSVPLPSARDYSASKPTSTPAKARVQAVPFNQYGSNLEEESLFSKEPILQHESISMTIILDDDSPPTPMP